MYNSNLQVNYRNLTPSVFLQRVNTALAEKLSYFEEQESPESRRAFSATMRKFANDKSSKFLEVNIIANSERQLSDVNLFLMRNLTAVKCSFGVLDSKNNTITLYICC